jgi:hypothetical protein
MGGRFHAKRLASDLNLISSSVSLPVRPGISGLGQVQSFGRSGNRTSTDDTVSTACAMDDGCVLLPALFCLRCRFGLTYLISCEADCNKHLTARLGQ